MAPIYQPLQVEAIAGERMVFEVHSERHPRFKYRVDLLAHGGLGECQCKNWHTRVWPLVRDGKLSMDDPCPDKHIAAARRVFLCDLLKHMAKGETAP